MSGPRYSLLLTTSQDARIPRDGGSLVPLKETIMATTPDNEEPGFEIDVNELPEDQNSSETTLEDPMPEDEKAGEMTGAQDRGAAERKEGGVR